MSHRSTTGSRSFPAAAKLGTVAGRSESPDCARCRLSRGIAPLLIEERVDKVIAHGEPEPQLDRSFVTLTVAMSPRCWLIQPATSGSC